MNSVSTTLAVSVVLWMLAGCGGAPGAAPPGPDATSSGGLQAASDDKHEGGDDHDRKHDDCMPPADFDEVPRHIAAQLNIARRAVCKFRRVEAAMAVGFVNTGLPCIPGQGYHYIKNSLVGTTDIREPSVLMYDKDGNLNSPEWVAPLDGFPTPPTIFGQVMHADDDLGLWIQHVWVWKLNPAGVFEDVNPNVTCP
ncbi:MAG TPA: hypothetical protein VFI53_05680 [Myxococcaceae bacterium]|nr:hypothetical protein [Myxococcaceae bacterium]